MLLVVKGARWDWNGIGVADFLKGIEYSVQASKKNLPLQSIISIDANIKIGNEGIKFKIWGICREYEQIESVDIISEAE